MNLDEWVAHSGQSKEQPDAQNLQFWRQAEVKAEHLTGDAHWDLYLSFLQAALEQTKEQAEALTASLSSPALVNYDEIMQCKIALWECEGRISAWYAAISLPKDLKEQGSKARGILERMNGKA